MGADVDKLNKFLDLIGAPPECSNLAAIIHTLHSSSVSIYCLAKKLAKLEELVSFTQNLSTHSHLLPREKSLEDNNPMYGRYDDYGWN